MTDERKPQKPEKPKIETLELNAETLQELTSGEAEGAEGGLYAQSNIKYETNVCLLSQCIKRLC